MFLLVVVVRVAITRALKTIIGLPIFVGVSAMIVTAMRIVIVGNEGPSGQATDDIIPPVSLDLVGYSNRGESNHRG